MTSVFFGEYDEHKWHDMTPILAIDKFTLVMFCFLLIVIGMFPAVIAPIVQSGIEPIVARVDEAREAYTVIDSLESVATNLMAWLRGM